MPSHLDKPLASLPPHLNWLQVTRLAQASLLQAVAKAIAGQHLDRTRYQHWLAMESALSRIGAGVMERIGDWHGGQPQLRVIALEWATCLRDDALAAAADVRALDGMTQPLPAQLGRWHAYADAACHSLRAGEALGTVLLHARLLEGCAHEAIRLALELPFLAAGGQSWLQRRCRPQASRHAGERDQLAQAWSATALAAGAQRAAVWHRAALESCFFSETTCVH